MSKKIILGVLIVMAIAICSAFVGTVPTVFAAQPTMIREAENPGTFEGEGYYVLGSEATLTATMNPGYQFDAWKSVDEEGNVIEVLSTEEEYTFVVERNMTIKAFWSKIRYNVSFDESLLDGAPDSLKDFTYSIDNINNIDGNYYYDHQLQITITPKANIYIYEINTNDIEINGTKISDISPSQMNVSLDVTADSKLLQQIVITVNIREDIVINMIYSYMSKLEIKSGNDIAIGNIIKFISVKYYDKQLDEYNYLTKVNKEISITISSGDAVYQLSQYKFQGHDYDSSPTASHVMASDTTFTIEYFKNEYDVTFNYYLKNELGIYNNTDIGFYLIDAVSLTAGDRVTFDYDESTKNITITDVTDGETSRYDYLQSDYGYRFVGFAYAGILFDENYYIMDDTNPSAKEIQVFFEYIEYEIQIQLQDDYFESGVTHGYSYPNGDTRLIIGTTVQLNATSTDYAITGWQNIPALVDDIVENTTDSSSQCTFVFKPNSDTQRIVITLLLDYKYSSVIYKLQDDNVISNIKYDIIEVNLTNNIIKFSDKASLLPSKTIVYQDSDISVNDGITTIKAGEFGNVVIDGDQLTYTVKGVNVSSVNKTTNGDVDKYEFEKEYSYSSTIEVAVIQKLTITQDGTNINVKIDGDIYNESGKITGEIQSINTTTLYDDVNERYIINKTANFVYDMHLYMKEDNVTYDYILFRNIKYYYDESQASFAPKYSTIATKNDIEVSVVKSSQYYIQLNNVLPTMALVYSAKTVNEVLYSFINFVNATDSILSSYMYNYNNRCILNATSTNIVTTKFRQLANDIMLNINNTQAYSYDNITFDVNGISGSGNLISAINGDIIKINIDLEKINEGYVFGRYLFNGNTLTTNETLEIVMNDTYLNQTIDIVFDEIQYTINVNYLDKDNRVIPQANANGMLSIHGEDTPITSAIVTISSVVRFNSTPNTGYYVGNAYIGTMAYELTGLITAGESGYWILNADNVHSAIIGQADEHNQVNLYIHFAIHKYSVKVNFQIATNAARITYPKLYINDVEKIMTVDGGSYYVEAEGYEHNSEVKIIIGDIMKGLTILSCTSIDPIETVTAGRIYRINNIIKNRELTIELGYSSYELIFEMENKEGDKSVDATITPLSRIVKLYDTVNYTISPHAGYILNGKYRYINNIDTSSEGIDSGFEFNPASFYIEPGNVAKIYFIIDLKTVTLEVQNILDGAENASSATFTVSRQREHYIEELTNPADFIFQTGDKLTVTIIPEHIGIEVEKEVLGIVNIGFASVNPYQLVANNVYEDDIFVGKRYILVVDFQPSVIEIMDENVVLQNILRLKTYKIVYTYNYIDIEFRIRLGTADDFGNHYAEADVNKVVEGVRYNSQIKFIFRHANDEIDIKSKFDIEGFKIADVMYDAPGANNFELKTVEQWRNIAFNEIVESSRVINVVLVLRPKITLDNYDSYSEEDGYLYEKLYTGVGQGLGASDILVSEGFVITVTYDLGAGFVASKPVNVGDYLVRIIATINIPASGDLDIIFDKPVTYKIIPRPVTLSLKTYSKNNPITKEYDGTPNLSSITIGNDIEINGLCDVDLGKIHIDIDSIKAEFEEEVACDKEELYDITVDNIYLLDNNNTQTKNYYIQSGTGLTFSKIGKIIPKTLIIKGFKPKDRVFTSIEDVSVEVDIEGIAYEGKIGTDSTQIDASLLEFYLADSTIGYDKKVEIDWINAISGADQRNYTVSYEDKYINIYPYEITYTLKDYGTFKLVDKDGLCLIPIGAEISVILHENGNPGYRDLYPRLEPDIGRGEKLSLCYEVTLTLGGIQLLIAEDLYIYMPMVKKLSKVVQVIDSEYTEILSNGTDSDYSIAKVKQGDAVFGIIVKTTYLPLWAIILIVAASGLVITLGVVTFVAIRKKMKNKYKKYNRI